MIVLISFSLSERVSCFVFTLIFKVEKCHLNHEKDTELENV